MLTIPQNPADGLAAVRERITVAARARRPRPRGHHPGRRRQVAAARTAAVGARRRTRRPRRKLRPGGARALRGAGRPRASAATSSARCRPTRRARPRSTSTGCTRWTGSRIAERLSAQRPESMPPLAVCLQVQPRRRVDQVRRRAGGTCRARGRGRGAAAARGCAASCACRPRRPTRRASGAGSRSCGGSRGSERAGHRLDALSMGMSGDYEAAIAEGATHVRIGTAVFGARVTARRH